MKPKLTHIVAAAGITIASISAFVAPAHAGSAWTSQSHATAQAVPIGFKKKIVVTHGGLKKKTFRHGQKNRVFFGSHGGYEKKTILVKSNGKLVKKTILVKSKPRFRKQFVFKF